MPNKHATYESATIATNNFIINNNQQQQGTHQLNNQQQASGLLLLSLLSFGKQGGGKLDWGKAERIN